MDSSVLLETERLRLERFTSEDADKLFELDSDPEVMRFLTGGPATPRSVIESQVLPLFATYDERHPALGFWAAIENSSNEFLGWFAFRPNHESDPTDVSLGFRLRRSAWGRGYATEGSLALVDLGLTKYGIKRVSATTYERNLASRRVLEKIGMKLVRKFRPTADELRQSNTFVSSGEVWDGQDLEYELTKREWNGNKSR